MHIVADVNIMRLCTRRISLGFCFLLFMSHLNKQFSSPDHDHLVFTAPFKLTLLKNNHSLYIQGSSDTSAYKSTCGWSSSLSSLSPSTFRVE